VVRVARSVRVWLSSALDRASVLLVRKDGKQVSASEKLKALDEWMPLHSNQSEPKLWELRRALPQIVAVVEAAEGAGSDPEWALKLDAALTGLEEALS